MSGTYSSRPPHSGFKLFFTSPVIVILTCHPTHQKNDSSNVAKEELIEISRTIKYE